MLQILEQKKIVDSVKAKNMALLTNILPDHVTSHFLNPKVDQSVCLLSAVHIRCLLIFIFILPGVVLPQP